ILDSLPENFQSLNFVQRNKILSSLSPDGNYKTLAPLVKKKFGAIKKRKSNASQYLSSKKTGSSSAKTKENVDSKGAIVLAHKLDRIIGYGSWGVVRECHLVKDPQIIRAVKIISTLYPSVKRRFKREIRIWSRLNHKRILPLLYVHETEDAIFCITPRIYGGTLYDVVSHWGPYDTYNSSFPIRKRLRIIRLFCFEILDGLSYMHYNGIVHGDLKLENCLVDEVQDKEDKSKTYNHILITDFGMSGFYLKPKVKQNSIVSVRSFFSNKSYSESKLSSHLSSSNQNMRKRSNEKANGLNEPYCDIILMNNSINNFMTPIRFSDNKYNKEISSGNENQGNLPHSHIGSLPYASPEILSDNPPPLGPIADIWAFGVLLYTMIVGQLPFNSNFEPKLREKIKKAEIDEKSLKQACFYDQGLLAIVKGCLTKDITKRWDLNMITEKLK
ncbi:protein kinase NNK1, partial [Ascoidea rubescens DSM 1968]